MPPTLADARAVLRDRYGYPDFRDGQARAITAVLAGRDVLALMPTGGGKSLCYQIPAAVLPGPTLVVSPLISLMQDQVAALERVGIAAAFVNSTLTRDRIRRRMEAFAAGRIKLLYVAPERFERRTFLERVAAAGVSLLAVDEAHCISAWGHEFRPSYSRLGPVRRRLGCPAIALTATATPRVRREIVRSLGLRRPRRVVQGFDRPNLEWHVVDARSDAERDALAVRLLRRRPDGSAIAYAATRKAVDALAERLITTGVPAAAYHGGVRAEERFRLQERFMSGEAPVIVATSAFGMGVDKPDVRLVVHHGMPRCLEDYYQEAGRAGRDGERARCVLLHRYRDRRVHEFFIRRAYPPRRAVETLLDSLHAAADRGGWIDAGVVSRVRPASGSDATADPAWAVLERWGVVRAAAAATGPAAGAPMSHRVLPRSVADRRLDWRTLRARRTVEAAKLGAMERFAYTRDCRVRTLLRYFGESPPTRDCGRCDRCVGRSGSVVAGYRAPRSRVLARLRERLSGGRRHRSPTAR